MHELSLLVAKREPGLPSVWSFVDGLNLTIESPSELDIQNAHYNGWLHYTACSSLLLWSADGLIRFATLNCPGSWHDSKIGTYGFYDAVRTQPCGYHIAGDSAFKTKLAGLLVVAKSSARRPADPRANLEWQKLQSALVSVRQCAEWGMGTFQATWKRTRTRLPYNPWYRKLLLETCVQLTNFRTLHVGLNQIKTVFGSLKEQESLGGYENVYGTRARY